MSSDSSHDSGYKLLFSHAQVVEDLLRVVRADVNLVQIRRLESGALTGT
jgi:hypothetical protein